MKLIASVILLFVSFQIQAQKISYSEKRSSYFNYVKGNVFEGVVFSKEFTFPFLENQKGDRRFTPTNEEIEEAECLLLQNLKSVNSLQINQGGENGSVIHNNC